jgi:arginine repressor
MVSTLIDQISLSQVLGCTYGDDTVMVITPDDDDAFFVKDKLLEMIN